MNQAIPVLLLILLAGSIAFSAWQYVENRQLTDENTRLKLQLDQTAKQLQATQTEQAQLQNELNQTQTQITQLDSKVQQLEQNITQLRKELTLQGYTTVGLTFLWPADVSGPSTDTTVLSFVVNDMNREWDPAHVFFFPLPCC